jgi:hypothetical protein
MPPYLYGSINSSRFPDSSTNRCLLPAVLARFCSVLKALGWWCGATTVTRPARNDQMAASALSLDLASKIVTVLDCGIEDLLEVVEG